MSDILNKHFTLKLNKNWKPIETPTVYDAILAMFREATAENGNNRPYCALDIDYPNINWPPVQWSDWVNLPVRPQDNYIQCAKKKIRVPTVIIANNYDDVPDRKVKFSKKAVKQRDGNRCVYSDEPVTNETGDLDHYIPLSLGGKTTFENVGTALKKINRLKRNMHPDEFFKLYPQYKRPKLYKPSAKQIYIVNTYGIQDWNLFIKTH